MSPPTFTPLLALLCLSSFTSAIVLLKKETITLSCPRLSKRYDMSSYPTYPTVTFKPPGDRPITLWTYDDADNAAAFECPSANKKEECRLLVDRANRTEQDGVVRFNFRVSPDDGGSALECSDTARSGYFLPSGKTPEKIPLTSLNMSSLAIEIQDDVTRELKEGDALNATCNIESQGDDVIDLTWKPGGLERGLGRGREQAQTLRTSSHSVQLQNYVVSPADDATPLKCVLRVGGKVARVQEVFLSVAFAPANVTSIASHVRLGKDEDVASVTCTAGDANPRQVNWTVSASDAGVKWKVVESDASFVQVEVNMKGKEEAKITCVASNAVGSNSATVAISRTSTSGNSAPPTKPHGRLRYVVVMVTLWCCLFTMGF